MNIDLEKLNARIAELEAENQLLKTQQIEINQAKELYLKIFEEFPALIWRSRLDKLCDYFNKTWYEFTGRSVEEEFGNGWAEGVHPDDFDMCLKIYVEAFDRHEAFLMEYRLKDRFGRYRWIRDFGRPFYDLDNSFLGYIGSCYDITEIKETEQRLTELNATKDKIFSIIAHDLRTPLNNVLNFVELLNMNLPHLDATKKQEMSEQLFRATKSAFGLLDNLLEWSQSQLHRVTFAPQWLKFSSICDEVWNPISITAENKEITLFRHFDDSAQIFADANMLKTILRNLLSNAVKFTRQGGIINLHAEHSDTGVTISVSDNGVGMSPEVVKNLFNVSTTRSTRGTANEKGTGLGLVICYEFIEKHGGRIHVESTQGQGSDFIIVLPFEGKQIAARQKEAVMNQ